MKNFLIPLLIGIGISPILPAQRVDYPAMSSPLVTNHWIGNASNEWSVPSNWSLGHVPLVTEDVVINTGYTYYPIISGGIARCNHFTLGTGARISLGNGDLEIGGNMTIAGQVDETHANADFMITGNVYWDAGSTANIANGEFHVEGHWFFNAGANAGFQYGTVFFTGSGIQYIYSKSAGCFFRHLTNDKTGGELRLDVSSTDSLKINGNLRNNTSASILRMESWLPVVLKGQFVNNGHIYYTRGTLILNGTTHSINLNTGDWLYNLVIKSTGATSLSDSLRIHGDLTISSGTLSPGSWPILINGNWTNNMGPGAFHQGTGKVVFKGAGDQFIFCSEDFNILELNLGGQLLITNAAYSVTCNQYLWTSGGLRVQPGTFTAHDLIQEGIFGNFWLYSGGTINLTNDDIVDLNGNLNIYGGNFNVVGLPGDSSYWAPYLAAGIFMNNGVLDFQNVGIKLPANAKPFTADISGGTIKCAGDLLIQKSGFCPGGGTFELTGGTAGRIFAANGSNLHHVVVNKTAATPVTFQSNTMNALNINGSLSILSGKVVAGSCDVYIQKNWQNSVGTEGFDAGNSQVVFCGNTPNSIIGTETFYNLQVLKTCPEYNGLTLENDITVLNNLDITDGCIEMDDPADLWIGGDITILAGAGLNADDPYGAQMMIGGSWINLNNGYTAVSGFSAQNSTVSFMGTMLQQIVANAATEVFHHLKINKVAGDFVSWDNLTILGDLQIICGTWNDYPPGLIHKISGNFSVNSDGIYTSFGSTLEFAGYANSVLTNNSPSSKFRNFLVNKTSNAMVTQVGNITLWNNGSMTIERGEYGVNGNSLTVDGDVSINYSGLLSMTQPSSALQMTKPSATISINQGGKLRIEGAPGNPCAISNSNAGNYQLIVNSGGTVSAENVLFSGFNANGVQIKAGAIVDPAHAFNGCTFSNGSLNGTLLTFNNSQELTISNAVFPGNLNNVSYSVAKTVNTGSIQFVDFSGSFSGEAFDNDSFNRIHWVPVANVVTGVIEEFSTECFDASNIITVGGDGTPFTVENGASATLIAGQRINYLPGSTVVSGGYMHGYITPDTTYCGNMPPLMAAMQTGTAEPEQQPTKSSFFSIFPNPARDKFTLIYRGEITEQPIMVKILDIQGHTILKGQITGQLSKQFSLVDKPSGLYLVMINVNGHYESFKLILQK